MDELEEIERKIKCTHYSRFLRCAILIGFAEGFEAHIKSLHIRSDCYGIECEKCPKGWSESHLEDSRPDPKAGFWLIDINEELLLSLPGGKAT